MSDKLFEGVENFFYYYRTREKMEWKCRDGKKKGGQQNLLSPNLSSNCCWFGNMMFKTLRLKNC